MAKDQTVSPGNRIMKADVDALAAIADMSDYAPANASFTLAELQAASAALKAAADAFAQAEADWQSARDNHVAAQWAFHNAMLGGKAQVVAQYGSDSNEAQAIGLTKKSERAKPSRRNTAALAKAA